MTQDRGGETPTTERVRAAHDVVYEEDGTIIDTSKMEDALRAYGVEMETATDGTTEYRNVPPEVPLFHVPSGRRHRTRPRGVHGRHAAK